MIPKSVPARTPILIHASNNNDLAGAGSGPPVGPAEAGPCV